MNNNPDKNSEPMVTGRAPKKGQTREDRLKAALKANMARRKGQTRARRAAEEPETKE